ncbi:RAMP superfamily CRISPR-associated protein [Geobacillus sp. C56-T2]|uniref:RAMP superfamily CRISPR-associated protein n=1 Tax=Geobacillus sp. C56-T2 TaxID=600773 RepID=UPI0011A95608|nr:RAMP superfamily CRISPR-associated protein [Geobacillus sp. C56-T2]NNV06826.1 hypothetical protein [Geobacillus sp. MMMUD3]TWG30826.1 CRISPR/Cas system CSM-associated protein Csm3 (group 7 of RAMP superfamily) [Geobacillus sp. C56-T2]
MLTFTVHLTIRFCSPFHIGTGEGVIGIIDRRTLSHHDTIGGKRMPLILGHTVKGIVRDRFRELSRLLNIPHEAEEDLFGSVKRQGSVYFSPWRIIEEERRGVDSQFLFSTKTGNQLVRSRRVAKQDHLFTYEMAQAWPTWEGMVSGVIEGEESTTDIPKKLVWLLLAIQSVRAVGGRRRAGNGACTVTIERLIINGQALDDDKLWKEPILESLGGLS